MYLTGVMPRKAEIQAQLQAEPELGVLLTPDTHMEATLADFAEWGADNGCFALKGRAFDAERWLAWLDTLPRTAEFVAIPDVLNWVPDPTGKLNKDGSPVLIPIGDAEATLALFPVYAARVRAMGFKVALVAQDGLEDLDIPWAELDAIFVGGSTEWKLGLAAAQITREAKRQGKWVHVGRVNSKRRYRYAMDVMRADSADGTFLRFGPDLNTPALLRWFEAA